MPPVGPGHERWADAAGAYLLGALGEDELRAYEAHLATCPVCREEVDELAPAADALPASVEPIAPPPRLKARIMAEVEREAELLAAAGEPADRPPPRRRWSFSLPRLAPLAAAAALLVLGVAVGLGIGSLTGGGGETVVAQVDQSRAPGARVELQIDDNRATLVARGLPAPPRGRVYEVWLKRPGRAPEPTSVLFTPSRDGSATAGVPGSIENVEQVLVTDEPEGGSTVPTRQPLMVAQTS
jgi:anti-sigma-K factor RskA